MNSFVKKRLNAHISAIKRTMLLHRIINDCAQFYSGNNSQKANQIAEDLIRFQIGYLRIKSGARRPRDEKELFLTQLFENNAPQSSRRILDFLDALE